MKAALDAGHGGGTGARGNGFIEDDLNYEMVARIGHYVRLNGIRTFMTRAGDRNIQIPIRTSLAKANRCDMLISIHFNAGPLEARGAECFTVAGDERSEKLAKCILKEIAELGIPIREVKADNQGAHTRLGILRGVYRQMPAVLVEPAFLTNPDDARLLGSRFFRDRLAKAIARAIVGV